MPILVDFGEGGLGFPSGESPLKKALYYYQSHSSFGFILEMSFNYA
jgi:hypothetical protein